MQSESPVSSPDVDFYEECVVTDEDVYVPPKHAINRVASPSVLKANKESGRVSKKSKCFIFFHNKTTACSYLMASLTLFHVYFLRSRQGA